MKRIEENKNSSQYLIEDNWWLLRIFASKNPWHTLKFVIPLICLWSYGVYKYTDSSDIFLGITLGILIWSFIEYAIHRWFFHALSDLKSFNFTIGSFHLYHHRTPRDPRVYTSGLIPALFWSLVVIGSLYVLGLSYSLIMITGLTLSLNYFLYEWVHYLVHVKEFANPIMSYLQKFHIDHHINQKVNFGQTSPLWDILLGTYKVPDEKTLATRLKHFFIDTKTYTKNSYD